MLNVPWNYYIIMPDSVNSFSTVNYDKAIELINSYSNLLDLNSYFEDVYADLVEDAQEVVQDLELQDLINDEINKSLESGKSPNLKIPASQKIIMHLGKALWLSEMMKSYDKYADNYIEKIEAAVDELKIYVSLVRRLFLGKHGKEKIIKAYVFLTEGIDKQFFVESDRIKEIIEGYKNLDEEDFWDDYIANKGQYSEIFKVVMDETPSTFLLPSVKAIVTAAAEARSIIDLYETFENTKDKYGDNVRHAVTVYRRLKLEDTLAKTDIQELSKATKGLRIKTLKDAGYRTVADVLSAKQEELSAIYGISGNAAATIKRSAEYIKKKMSETINIDLNYYDQTEGSTQIVRALYQYKENWNLIKETEREYKNLLPEVKKALEYARKVKGGCTWLFYTEDTKKTACHVYSILKGFSNSSVSSNILAAKQILENAAKRWKKQKVNKEEAWNDCKKHGDEYRDILFEIYRRYVLPGSGSEKERVTVH